MNEYIDQIDSIDEYEDGNIRTSYNSNHYQFDERLKQSKPKN
jgi:hypothetical protein